MESAPFDAEYVHKLIGGDPATEHHFVAYFSELLRIKLRSRVRSPQLAEDICQETFLRVLTNLRKKGIQRPESLGAYVNSFCNNILFESFRGEARFLELNDEGSAILDPRPGTDDALLSDERKKQVATVLLELHEKDRELLNAVFLNEEDKDSICRRMGVDRGYLRVLLHRARNRFGDLFKRRYAAG